MTTIPRLLEKEWSALDEDYLGKFEDQAINVPHYPEGTPKSLYLDYLPRWSGLRHRPTRVGGAL